MKFQEQMYNIKMLYCYIISTYHLYGIPRNFGENSNGTVHKGGNFPEKSNTFRVITVFLFLRKLPKFSLPLLPSNVTGIFLALKTGTGLSCTIYKILVNCSLSLDMKPSTGSPNKFCLDYQC